jgi:hypothetical protein
MDDRLTRAPVGIVEAGPDGEIEAVNPAGAAILDADRKQLEGQTVTDALPRSASATLHEALATDPVVERSVEEYYPAVDRWLAAEVTVFDENAVVYLRDVTERHNSRQTVERLQQRLSRLESIDALITGVLQQILDASDREEVWETVVRRLGTADLYEFVWVGERDPADDCLRVAASAGEAPDVLAAIDAELGSSATLPAQRAVETGSVCTVEVIPDDQDIPRDLRVAAFSRGLQSAVAVPISSGGTLSGVLGVYVGREEGISPQERAGLDALGAVAGFAMTAIRQADLLFADTVTELRLAVRDESVPFVAASAAADTSLSLDGAIVEDNETVVCYLRTGSASDPVTTTLADHPAVSDVRPVRDGEESTLVEVKLSGQSPLGTLTDWGATVTDANYTAEAAEVVMELPPEGDVRAVVEAVDEQFADTTVRSRTEHTREPETMEAFRQRLGESLTEKQRRVLRTAHLADYFESPRGSTSKEVAEALDISGPTVLYHLRNAQRKLLNAFFDGDDAAAAGPDLDT